MKIRFILAVLICLVCPKLFALDISGLMGPYGVAVDQKTGFVYVSNINGEPETKDDNGFISRLKGDGTLDNLRFIDGASGVISLSAPKGMAIVGNNLYVCDLDTLHSFDLQTGKLLFDVNFGDLPHSHFYSIIIGPDGALYIADAPSNTIYRIDIGRQHEVTKFISGDEISFPRGIVWYPARQVFAISSFGKGQIVTFDKMGKRQDIPLIFVKDASLMDVDDFGNIYLTSFVLNSAYRISPSFALFGYQTGLNGPAGVAYNRASKNIFVVSFGGNALHLFPAVGSVTLQ